MVVSRIYTCIKITNLYIHIEQYCDHLRVVQVTHTDQIILCLYNFYSHGVLHTKSIGASVYIVDIEHYYHNIIVGCNNNYCII
jgi:hypothetical protein